VRDDRGVDSEVLREVMGVVLPRRLPWLALREL
jgi:hypothetical protein